MFIVVCFYINRCVTFRFSAFLSLRFKKLSKTWKMLRLARLSIILSLAGLTQTRPQPPAGCLDYEHCSSGYYCDNTLRLCQRCVQCEDLGRRSPDMTMTVCLKSVAECGACLNGLVANTTKDRCVPEEEPFPYWWAVIGCSQCLAVIICAAVVHLLRHFHTFKILACTTTRTVESLSSVGVEANAPAPPPPPYSTVMALPSPEQVEELAPFIKPVPEPSVAENQTARVFNNPAFNRTLQPPSYDFPSAEGALPTIREDALDRNIGQSGEENNGSHSEVHAADNTATTHLPLVEASTMKLDQNCNLNKDKEDNTKDGASQHAFSCSGTTAFIINVIKNVNTVHQQNEMTL